MNTNKNDLIGFHPIDLSKDTIPKASIANKGDLDGFVDELVVAVFNEKNKQRSYKFKARTTEVCAALHNAITKAPGCDPQQTIADRLHRTERATEARIAKLGQSLQKGTLLQIYIQHNGTEYILIVKVDFHFFLDHGDFKKHVGLPFERKVLKACLVEYGGDGIETSVVVFDSNSSFAGYWWSDFLELEELNTDERNTEKAYFAVLRVLDMKLKKKHKADHTLLRNNLVGFFRTQQNYDHGAMLEYVFGQYHAQSPTLDIEKLKKEIDSIPAQKGFDRTFPIKEGVVRQRYKRVIPLSEKIDLQLKADIEDLANTIVAEKKAGDVKGIFIKTEGGYEWFKKSPTAENP